MKPSDLAQLSPAVRQMFHNVRLLGTCLNALLRWNRDHPEQQFPVEHFREIFSAAFEFFLEGLWAEQGGKPERFPPMSFPNYSAARLGGLLYGWRSRPPETAKSKGALQRGLAQIIGDHWASLDFEGAHYEELLLDGVDATGKTYRQIAREMHDLDTKLRAKQGKPPANWNEELAVKAIEQRIRRL